MPRSSSLSPDNILRFLQVTKEAASTNEIGTALHVARSQRKPLFNMLVKLKKRGAIEELPGGRYRLAGPKGRPEGGDEARVDRPRATVGDPDRAGIERRPGLQRVPLPRLVLRGAVGRRLKRIRIRWRATKCEDGWCCTMTVMDS